MGKDGNQTKKMISPIAIDLGAKNTGVYYAHYEAGTNLNEININKEGKVYQLEQNKYTLLMASRTAQRHQRRGFDRRQLVKRLFKLIWVKHFDLPWDRDIQQTVSFLLNRRGFTFLTEGYNEKVLSKLPKEVYDLLPNEVKNDVEENKENGGYNFDSALTEWSREGQQKLKSIFDALNKEPKQIAQRQVFINRTKKLKKYCQSSKEQRKNEIKKLEDLSRLSRWIIKEWNDKGVKELPSINSKEQSIDLIKYLENQNGQIIENILDSLPDTTSENTELIKSIWNFKSESFSLEQAKFNVTDSEGNESEKPCIKTHLNHLAFAIYKNLEELKLGSRHRSKYFEEIKNVLENKNHTHSYLKIFYDHLQSGQFKELNVENLTHLIGHLSNLELKPLRKYFNDNDKEHKNNDYWDEGRLNKLFDRWILHEWRINPVKDKDKAEDKDYDYKKLCKNWKKYKKDYLNTVINFWLKTCPNWTIPPYQDNNNRRPPKCQSLILNPKFLDKKIPSMANMDKDSYRITKSKRIFR